MDQAYSVSGMHCQGCARKIETALGGFGTSVTVDHATASLRISSPTATLDAMNRTLAAIGDYKLSAMAEPVTAQETETGLSRYYPLLLIAAFLTVGSFAGAQGAGDWMRHFMAGFFLVFSFFKLLDIRAFAESYAMYDLIAGRWKPYGSLYPFLELGLGLAYLFAWNLQPALFATLALTIVSGLGVVRSMTRKQVIRCACLGAVLNLPVSTVTLIEDFGMAAMAVAMLLAQAR